MSFEYNASDAESRIAAHRQGDFHLFLRDASGAPATVAALTVELASHDFRLGANGFLMRDCDHKPSDSACDEGAQRDYEQQFTTILNYATLPFYWGGYEPQAGEEKTERLLKIAAWCRAHGLRLKGHPLAWHEVFPAWAKTMDDAEVLRRLRERVSRITGVFRGVVDTWDVVNEATVAAHFDNAVGRWIKDRGAVECVAEALALARDANPDAELLYNDFNVSPAFEALVDELQARGASFDVIGIQSHMHKGVWPLAKVWEICESYARFRMPLHFTELTIVSGHEKYPDDNDWHKRHTDWVSTPEGEQRQLEEGSAFYTLLFSHPAVEAITWWDFSDRGAWQGAPSGLLRSDMSLKPLAEWLRMAFAERWTTRAALQADAAGQAAFRGYFGTYHVQATTASGEKMTGSCTFPRHGSRKACVTLKPV